MVLVGVSSSSSHGDAGRVAASDAPGAASACDTRPEDMEDIEEEE